MKEQEDYIEYLAGHDYLTKLPNRMSFMEKVYEKLGEGKKGAIILLDDVGVKSPALAP
jgi:GGDEF domain-containing protein